jgi:hypothetical protein
MRRFAYPYQIFLVLVASMTMTFLLKINKQDFYFHYFKVIEEVEMRNSQEVVYTSSNFFLTSSSPKISESIIYLGFLSLGLLLIVIFNRPFLTLDNFRFKVPLVNRSGTLYFLTPPIRAPQA